MVSLFYLDEKVDKRKWEKIRLNPIVDSILSNLFIIKGLSIESLLWGNGDGALKVFGDQGGLGITFWAPLYPKIGGGKISSEFSRARGLHLTFAPLYMLGLEPETCGDRTERGLPGRYSPVSNLFIIKT